jgi:hypothetical protein
MEIANSVAKKKFPPHIHISQYNLNLISENKIRAMMETIIIDL